MDKEQLFRPRLEERDVQVEGVGVFRVRALSRAEVLKIQQEGKGNADLLDTLVLCYGLVDPKLDFDEATRWRNAAPIGEIEPVSDAIVRLSGLGDGALEDAEESFR